MCTCARYFNEWICLIFYSLIHVKLRWKCWFKFWFQWSRWQQLNTLTGQHRNFINSRKLSQAQKWNAATVIILAAHSFALLVYSPISTNGIDALISIVCTKSQMFVDSAVVCVEWNYDFTTILNYWFRKVGLLYLWFVIFFFWIVPLWRRPL